MQVTGQTLKHTPAAERARVGREMLRGGYCPALLPMRTPQGDLPALVFTANTSHPEYVGELPLHETTTLLSRARVRLEL